MATKRTKRSPRVREPLQVYLDPDERGLLDRLARETGLSRAEILRRGLKSFAAERRGKSPMLEFMDSMQGLDFPPDMGARHDDYLAEAYLDTHDKPA
jgi:hypothetical protein